MPAPISPAKRVKTSHRTPAAHTLTPAQPDPPPLPLTPLAPPTPPRTPHRLFVGGCPTNLTASQLHADLQRRFSSFGAVTGVDVIAGPGGCKGFGYVDVATERLEAVLATFKGSKWRGQWFRVEEAQPDYLTRLRLHQAADAAAERQALMEPVREATLPQMDWEQHVYRFRLRPGVRVRIPHRTSVKHFPLVPSPLLDQPGQQPQADEEQWPEVAEADGRTRVRESVEEFRERLQRSKEEVERIWLPQKDATQPPQPKQLTKKQRLALKRRAQQQADDDHPREPDEPRQQEQPSPIDLPSEDELGVVDFDDDAMAAGEGDEAAGLDETAGMTEEERLKWQEEKEWAMLEDDGGGEWMDDEGAHKDGRQGQDSDEPVSFPTSGAESEVSDDNEVDEWAALESGAVVEQARVDEEDQDEAERDETMEAEGDDDERKGEDRGSEQDSATAVDMDDEAEAERDDKMRSLPATVMDQLSFPKLSSADWFDDDDDDDANPLATAPASAASMEQRMQALSSRLVASQGEFNVRPAYEGKNGQQLLRLKQTYRGDQRFALDDRFAAAAIDQHRVAQAEGGTQVDEVAEAGDGDGDSAVESELKRQLHAETIRALQVLDVVAPGPSPFHTTLPRFSHKPDAEQRASEAALSEVERDAASIEAELNEAEMRKSVTMWRRVQRYDPDKDEPVDGKKAQAKADGVDEVAVGEEKARKRPESKTERKRRLRQERQERQRQQRQQAAITQPNWPSADDDELDQPDDTQQQPSHGGATARYELNVPRLRDLITDRSTVVQFSFAFDSTAGADPASGQSSTLADAESSDVAMNVYAPLPDAFPTRPAAMAVLPPVPAVQPIAGAAIAKRPTSLHSTAQQHQTPDRSQPAAKASAQSSGGKGRLSDLLALAQQAHSGGGGVGRAVGAVAAVSSDEDDVEGGGVFMRRAVDGDVESEWRRWRASIRDDYKKKNKLAVRQESNKQMRNTATLPWAKSKRKATAAREDGGSKSGTAGRQ